MATSLRVLILEDRPADAKLLVHELRRAGFDPDWQRVDTENDYLTGLEPAPDIILADYSLPQWNASHALHVLQERGLDIPFVIVSGTIGEDLAVECMRQGAADYLLKDRLGRLGQAVTQALQSRRLREERRQIAASLRKTEELNRAILSSLHAHIVVVDRDGKIIAVNETWQRFARANGAPTLAEQSVGIDYLHVCRQAGENGDISALEALAGLQSVLDGSRAEFVLEYPCHSPTEQRWFDMHAVPLADDSGSIVISHTSITERKRAEEALRTSEEKYRTLFEESFDGLFITSPAGKILDMNKKGVMMFGYNSKEEIRALDLEHDVYAYPPDRQRILAMVNAQGTAEYEVVVKKKGGEQMVTYCSLTAVNNEQGLITSYRGIIRDITERKRAEEALRESEATYRNLLTHLQAGVVVRAPDTRVLMSNDAANAFFGMTADEMLGRTVVDQPCCYLREDGTVMAPEEYPVNRVIATGQPLQAFMVGVNNPAFAQVKWALVTAYPHYSEQGELQRVVITFVDITERKQAEATRATEHNLLRAVIDNLPDYIVAKDIEGRFLLSNVAHAQGTLGALPEDLIGKTALELYPPYLASQYYDDDVRILKTGEALISAERLTLGPEGQERTVLTTKVPLRDSRGAVIGLVGISRDITERKRAEQALHESEMKFRRFVEESTEGIVLTDEHGLIVEWNRSQEQLTGLRRANVLGQPIREVQYRLAPDAHHPQIPPIQAGDLLLDFLRTGRAPWASQVMEGEIQRPDGAMRSVQVIIFPVPSGKGYIGAIVSRDITEEKRLQQAEREQRELADTLSRTAIILSKTLDLNTLLENIMDLIGPIVPFDAVAFTKIEGNALIPLVWRGFDDRAIQLNDTDHWQLSNGIPATQVIASKQTVITSIPRPDGLPFLEIPGFEEPHCRMLVPVIGYDVVIGYLLLMKRQPGFYNQQHAGWMTAFASQVSTAYINAQLYEELQQHARQLEQRVQERTADLRRAKEHVEAILNSSSDGVVLASIDSGIRQTNPAFDALFVSPSDSYLNKPLSDLVSAEDVPSLDEALLATTRGTVSRIEIWAQRSDGTLFSAEIGLAPVMENEAVSGMVVCILRDITERKQAEANLSQQNLALTTLHAGALEIASELDMPALLRRIIERAVSLLSAQRGGGFYLYDREANLIRLEAGIGINEERVGITLRPDEGVVGQVFQTGRPLIVNDYTRWDKHATILVADPSSAVIGVPLFMQGQIVGALLAVANSEERIFTSDDVHMAEMFAAQASVALRNSHLYSAAQHEIAERKRTENALRESEELFRQIAENFDQILFLGSNDDQKILYVNPRYETMWGLSRESLYENPASYFERIHPDDLEYVRQTLMSQRYLEEGIADYEFRVILPDQSIRWVRARRFPIQDAVGAIVRRVGIVEDTTERKIAEQTLRESEERFRLLLDGAPIATIISNRMGYITLVNRQAEVLFGYDRTELVGQKIEILVPEHIRDRHIQHRVSYMKTPHVRPIGIGLELGARHRDAHSFPVEIQLSSLEVQNDLFILSFIIDITERKKAEQALQQALAKEQELGELKTRFVSMASHEFRTPLATILATTETLSAYRQKLTEEQIGQKLLKITEQVGHLKDIMEDVLMLARMQQRRVEFEPILLDPSALCRTIIEEFESRPDIHHQIFYTFDGQERNEKLDKKLIRQMISNLISNAIKYSPSDKPVTVHLAMTPTAVVFRVSDQGIGIPESDQSHLFEPFHRATNVGSISGTGLGLVITKEAVDMHRGTITVESQLGIGTTFTVRIPVTL